ncbi:hypothetical protein FHS27_005706 [Rhodopirellula rubra]|uniref:Uncharacterized protein n=1 Tax=Aporhodopirellula rubra TaxID=980271 RepID=A0A7W5E450_9BACT|nr:hypothetical protein [Aporhodopirellula rubra]MBB3209861.1 hypothetical protein [Aporhodopirellula rubra]
MFPSDSQHSSSDPGTTTMRGLLAMDNLQWRRVIDGCFQRVYQCCLATLLKTSGL